MISTSNVLEISGVLLKNEIKNIYCFLKIGTGEGGSPLHLN